MRTFKSRSSDAKRFADRVIETRTIGIPAQRLLFLKGDGVDRTDLPWARASTSSTEAAAAWSCAGR